MAEPDLSKLNMKNAIKKLPLKQLGVSARTQPSKESGADRKLKQDSGHSGAQKLKTRAIAVSVAAAATLGLLVGNTFDNPAELTQVPDDSHIIPIVQIVTNDIPQNDGGAVDTPEDPDDERKKLGILRRIRLWILGLPLWARILFCVPLWGIGAGLTVLVTAIGGAALPGFAASLLHVAATSAILLALLIGTCKLVAPDLPAKEMLKPRRIVSVIACALIAEAALTVLSLCLNDGEKIARLVHCLLSLLTLGAVTLPMLRQKIKANPGTGKNELPETESCR